MADVFDTFPRGAPCKSTWQRVQQVGREPRTRVERVRKAVEEAVRQCRQIGPADSFLRKPQHKTERRLCLRGFVENCPGAGRQSVEVGDASQDVGMRSADYRVVPTGKDNRCARCVGGS
ncbi:hypothetical protein THI4931_47310 [Pandoraea sputorum]|nr:hypothetical protein THI4931_47310 [Pandoraea sputorum]